MKNVRNPHILRTFSNFLVFLAFNFSGLIRTPPKWNQPIQATSKPYDDPKNFKKSKEVENREGTNNVRNLHILRTVVNFLVFLDFDFSVFHLTTF